MHAGDRSLVTPRNLLLVGALAAACMALRLVQVPAAGMPASSLLYLQAGLLLTIAMFDASRRVLAVCIGATALAWMAQVWPVHGARALIGIPLYGLHFLIALGGARLAGWPRRDPAPIDTGDILRFVGAGLLLLPSVSAAAAVLLPHWAFGTPAAELPMRLAQGAVATHLGILVLTLPAAFWLTESADAPRLSPGTVLPALGFLALGFVLGRWQGTAFGESLGEWMLDYRLLAAAALAWCVMRFPARWSMPAIAGTMLILAYAVAERAGTTPHPVEPVLLGLELVVLEVLLLVLHAVTRDGRLMRERLIEEAGNDSLTGLPNLKALRTRVSEDDGTDEELGYLVVDNADRLLAGLGLNAHTALMRAVAERLSERVQPYYVTSAQFVLMRQRDDHRHPDWQQVLQRLESLDFEWNGVRYRVVPYVGHARIRNSRASGLEAAIIAASQAAFQARILREVMPIREGDTARMQDVAAAQRKKLDEASSTLASLRTGEVALYFQPMRRIGESEQTPVSAGEVVCRLRTPDGEWVSPARFTHELEAAGRLVELDRAVIRELFRWIRAHRQQLGHLRHIGVNLTGQSLTSPGFVRELQTLMSNPPLPPEVFCFEITESAAISDLELSRRCLNELRALGCHVAIDDFGTGVQSFERLKQLPFDLLKIDGSFVRNALHIDSDYQLVRASVTIAHAFGAEAVAEYVESPAILACMKELGVEWVQGNLYGKAAPIEWLTRSGPWPT